MLVCDFSIIDVTDMEKKIFFQHLPKFQSGNNLYGWLIITIRYLLFSKAKLLQCLTFYKA